MIMGDLSQEIVYIALGRSLNLCKTPKPIKSVKYREKMGQKHLPVSLMARLDSGQRLDWWGARQALEKRVTPTTVYTHLKYSRASLLSYHLDTRKNGY